MCLVQHLSRSDPYGSFSPVSEMQEQTEFHSVIPQNSIQQQAVVKQLPVLK